MTTVEFDVVVDAPPEAVWKVISDPRRLPHWDRHIVRVEGVPADGLREGMRYTTEMRFMLLRSTIGGEVLVHHAHRLEVLPGQRPLEASHLGTAERVEP